MRRQVKVRNRAGIGVGGNFGEDVDAFIREDEDYEQVAPGLSRHLVRRVRTVRDVESRGDRLAGHGTALHGPWLRTIAAGKGE